MQVQRMVTTVLAGVLLSGMVGTAEAGTQMKDWRKDDFSLIRGANYVPTYALNDVAIWENFDPEIIDRELGYGERAGVNSVRVFLQIIVYQKDPKRFLDRFETFLDLCDKHHMTMMPVLFDSCFGAEPTFDAKGWVANPGNSTVAKDAWPECEEYIKAVVVKHRGDQRIAMWDVMNEPMVAGAFAHTEDGREKIKRFVRHFVQFVNDLDETHATTVGIASVQEFPYVTDLERVISFHSYFGGEENHRRDIALAKEESKRQGGKALNVSECGHYALDQTYEMALNVCRELNVGYYLWELMIGIDPFPGVQGIFYPDGTIRSADDYCAVAGVKKKLLIEGVIPTRGIHDEEFVSLYTEALATPTRAWNLNRRLDILNSRTLFERLQLNLVQKDFPDITVEDMQRRAQQGDKAPLEKYAATHPVIVAQVGEKMGEIRRLYREGKHDEAFATVDEWLRSLVEVAGVGQNRKNAGSGP